MFLRWHKIRLSSLITEYRKNVHSLLRFSLLLTEEGAPRQNSVLSSNTALIGDCFQYKFQIWSTLKNKLIQVYFLEKRY